MKNEYGKEKKNVLDISVMNGATTICDDSMLDSVAAVYMTIVTATEMKDHDMKIYVNKDTSVEVVNEYGNVVAHWTNDLENEQDSRLLLYVLSEKVEFLLYKSDVQTRDFHLSTIPVKSPCSDGIIRKVEILPNYKAYKEIQRMLFEQVSHPYKNKYEFIFNDAWKDAYCR